MYCDILTDQQFLEAFEKGEIPNHAFRHVDHLRMCFLYLQRNDFEAAAEKIVCGIQRFAALNNVPKLYHHTITWFWIHAVDTLRSTTPTQDFGEFLGGHSGLKNKDHILDFYSKPLLLSDTARNGWVEPDLKAIFPPVEAGSRGLKSTNSNAD